MQREVPLAEAREVLTSRLKRGPVLARGSSRLRLDTDGSVTYLQTSEKGGLVFGREAVEVFRVQSGVRIPFKSKDARLRLSPGLAEFRSQDAVQVSQTLRLFEGASAGYSRSVRVMNRTDALVRVRVLTLHDPTSLAFRRERDPPGEIGVNAFNRGDQVVMDDVGDTTGVRVIGFSPMPTAVYMTRDKQRAVELLSSGEVTDTTAGMSGAILVLSQREFELKPGASSELSVRSVYNASSLEAALADLSSLVTGVDPDGPVSGPSLRTSSPAVNFAFAWASASMMSVEGEPDLLERLSSGFGLRAIRPGFYESSVEECRKDLRKDGLLPHSGAGGAGHLETALFVIHACAHLQLRPDKRASRKWYPFLRKAAMGLLAASSKGLIVTDPSAPGGWRRRLTSGYPTGQLSEVNLVAARALADVSVLAYSVGKGADSATLKEASMKLGAEVLSRLKDPESGTLALNIDPKGRLHREVTVDQAVALYYNPLDHDLASSFVHRLLEKDFETGYGPRTVPTSNLLYYSPSYGDGQLGGFWTRAALAHALLAYRSGYPVIGGQGLEKVARLVQSDCEVMGGVPGEFPYWLDPDRRAVGPAGSDPVAASFFIEAVLTGELGISSTPRGVEVAPPTDSKLRWFSVHQLDVGDVGSLFLGRCDSGPALVASTFQKVAVGGTRRTYSGCERVESPPAVESLVFWDQTSILICVGNLGNGDQAGRLSFPVRGKPLSRSLFAELDEFDHATSSWKRLERRKLLDAVDLDLEVKSSGWRAFRLSQITS